MIDTDKYGMTNEELLERYSNLSVDDYKELLAEVKRLRKLVDEHNEVSWYQREWVEKLFENMGRSSADVAQAVENFQNYRGD